MKDMFMKKESQGTSTSTHRRKILTLGGVATGIAALGGGGWFAWKTWGDGRPSDTAYITATVQRGDIEDLVSAIGSLQPRNYVDVGAQVSGQLRKIAVEVGSEVHEGQLLAEVDAEQSAARVDASRAQLRAQQAQMAERELALGKAERDLERQKNLMAEEATTAETLQNAETTARSARAQISSLKAQMEQLQASMRVEEANLKYTRIYAPMDGTVVSIAARQGQTLNANQAAPNLLRIADLSVMTVQTQVSEADVARLRIDMPVYFTTLGGQGRRWYGQLKKVEPTPTVTNNVVLYNALFEVPNPGNLMTQMTAQVFFVSAEVRDALLVPMSALTIQRGGPDRQERGARAGASAPVAAPASAPVSSAIQSGPVSTPPQAAASVPARRNTEGGTGKPGVASNAASAAKADPSPAARGPGAGFDREAWQNMSEEERQKFRAERRAAREAAGEQRPGERGGETREPRGGQDARSAMSEEERQKLRAQRMAAREARGDQEAKPSTPAAPGGNDRRPEAASAKPSDGAVRSASRDATAPRRSASAAGGSPQRSGATPGAGRTAFARPAQRRAKVKVVLADGTLQERDVLVGVSNRVHAEILSGLNEGDRVVAGVRQPENTRRSAGTPASALGQQNFGAPAGAGGAAGRGR